MITFHNDGYKKEPLDIYLKRIEQNAILLNNIVDDTMEITLKQFKTSFSSEHFIYYVQNILFSYIKKAILLDAKKTKDLRKVSFTDEEFESIISKSSWLEFKYVENYANKFINIKKEYSDESLKFTEILIGARNLFINEICKNIERVLKNRS